MNLTTIAPWQLLSAIGLLLVLAEIIVPGFVMLPIGVGFLLTAGAAAFTSNWTILMICLAAFELGTFWFFKEHLKKFHGRTRTYTNVEGMLGAECTVIEPIPKGGTGYVKLYGDSWMAKSFTGEPLKNGARVVIAKVEGNKVYVEPIA